MKNSWIFILIFWCWTACSGPKEKQEQLTLPMEVAKAYGYENFKNIKSIHYTWNVQIDSARQIARTWTWNIPERVVHYTGQDTSMQYSLTEVNEGLEKMDHSFINDKYWLMFPFQLAWDRGYEYEVEKKSNAPISGQPCTRLTIIYPQDKGYTPGDAYDLFIDDNNMIMEWVYRKGNGSKGRAYTWEGVKQYGGIKLATEHKNEAGEMKIWFSDIQVK
ncbi:hypothetical protein QWY93_03490 [Echinicola jeungdonensis]|uniref:Uncharacterized protein n=1 Tax=Echinicola jeungdonensis TaxID=709343 RepID=A0ABV5J157_9BACT|nr:hypothetical protein [Echinicola jeungdonensis]MDN3668389.1 hypothetical protein [Echinicola jeungdonensis]